MLSFNFALKLQRYKIHASPQNLFAKSAFLEERKHFAPHITHSDKIFFNEYGMC